MQGLKELKTLLLLLLSRFSRVRPCATPEMAAQQAPPSLGFSRQEHWSGLSFPSPMHESEKWKWSHSVVSDSSWPHGLQPTRLLHPGKSAGVGCHCLGWLNSRHLNCLSSLLCFTSWPLATISSTSHIKCLVLYFCLRVCFRENYKIKHTVWKMVG